MCTMTSKKNNTQNTIFPFKGERISIKGAREHNLKNIDIDLPRNKLVVLSGLSGSDPSKFGGQ